MLRSIYRPYRSGSIPALIHARSMGHYIVPTGWRDNPIRKKFLELFWSVSGTGEFRCREKSVFLNAGEVCFYFPGDCHHIRAQSPWEYYWLTIDGPDPELLIRLFHLERPPRHAGKCPAELFNRLSGELRDTSARGEFRAGATVYEILSLAMGGAEPEEEGRLRRFRELMEDSFEYLLSLRVQEALRLLNDTEYSIKEIAECTGFHDPNYFTKVITRRLGKPPSCLRRS